MSLFLDTYAGKKVLITGHTGFKGSWLATWLETLGAQVIGIALDPPSQPSHFEVAGLTEILEDHRLDIRDGEALKYLVSQTQPDFVFHLAAQSLVHQSYLDPVETSPVFFRDSGFGDFRAWLSFRPLIDCLLSGLHCCVRPCWRWLWQWVPLPRGWCHT